jgi:predicted acetyltransferase
MSVEIRPCADETELKAYGEIVSYVFASNEGMDEELATTQPDWTMCAFIDGKMGATMGTFPFTVRLNGAPVAMGGVTAVGTLPQYRRQGLLRQIMTKGLATCRERNQSIAILWASMGAIYQRFGYGLAATQIHYSFDPRYAGFESGPAPQGTVSLMGKEDAFPLLKQNYIRYATPRNLMIHRSVPLWEAGTLRPPKKDQPVHVGVYHNAEGELRGHVVYCTEPMERDAPGPNHLLSVRDFIALDMDAYRGLWEYIRRHDLVGKVELRNNLPEDDPAPDLLLEPRMLNRRTSDGVWLRVVDVEKALPQRPYGARGELTFRFESDDVCPWNNGTYLLETDGQTTDVRRVDREPDLVFGPNALATLIAGHRSATHLFRAGLLEAPNQAALPRADAMFRTEYVPHCPNGF